MRAFPKAALRGQDRFLLMRMPLALALSVLALSICEPRTHADGPPIAATIERFVGDLGLPLDVERATPKLTGPVALPGVGVVRRAYVAGHVFALASDGNVTAFVASRPWGAACKPSSPDLSPPALLAKVLAATTKHWAHASEISGDSTWSPELEGELITARLLEARETRQDKVMYKNRALARFDSGHCLRELIVSQVTVSRTLPRVITKATALAKANARLAEHKIRAYDATLELRSVSGRAVLVWVPEVAMDDIQVLPSLWVDARNGRAYPARDELLGALRTLGRADTRVGPK